MLSIYLRPFQNLKNDSSQMYMYIISFLLHCLTIILICCDLQYQKHSILFNFVLNLATVRFDTASLAGLFEDEARVCV